MTRRFPCLQGVADERSEVNRCYITGSIDTFVVIGERMDIASVLTEKGDDAANLDAGYDLLNPETDSATRHDGGRGACSVPRQ